MHEKITTEDRGFWRKFGEIFLYLAGILCCLAWVMAIAHWWYREVIINDAFVSLPQNQVTTTEPVVQSLARKVTITTVCIVLLLPALRVLLRKIRSRESS